MAVRVGVIILLAAVVFSGVAESFPTLDSVLSMSSFVAAGNGGSQPSGKVGDFIDEGEEMQMESESARRALKATGKFISYQAMRQGNIPCGLRGASYYACDAHGQANPYKRGCSKIGRCAKNTK